MNLLDCVCIICSLLHCGIVMSYGGKIFSIINGIVLL